ncbi:hypothetical protein [Adhaeribacter rhizoryzae]|uniref:Uncharacterized protein n=1 Tax=Adhaeribacter rhizoryzae TaxID=2607907 RepID=A0A5M6CVF4_9BACT|nr:hypothetical protein [Adhaeribacter rhizoryzae]KAA5539237.1 hypothetical protein F0145_24690 [Adhaeribacter rhizoryzae]
MCDPHYIEWCIKDTFEFFLVDLDELDGLDVINYDLNYYHFKIIDDPEVIPYLNYYKTLSQSIEDYKNLMSSENLPRRKFYFSEDAKIKNSNKLNSSTFKYLAVERKINDNNIPSDLANIDVFQVAINKGMIDIPYGNYEPVKYMGTTKIGLRKIVYKNIDTGVLYPFFGIDSYSEL